MKLTVSACITVACLLVPLRHLAAQGPPAAPATPCASVTDVTLACGQQGPEDLYALPNAQWVVAAAMGGSGGINLIRVSDRTSTRIYPSPAAKTAYDAKRYPGCPGPPGASDAQFRTHGLWLEPKGGANRHLYAVGHGARESIEVFIVDTKAATPVLTWIGCVVAPDPIGLNSVVGLSDGGFITSNYNPRGVPEATKRMMAGEKNGELWEWHTGTGWQKIPGSEAAGANGLEISNDGRWFYVAAWGSQSFFRLSRGQTPPKRDEIPLGFRVDNIRWAADGSLLAAGQGGTPAAQTSNIVKINPETMAVRDVIREPASATFGAGTVAVEVGSQIWVGSFRGDRIAIFPASR
jgi:hypothetical protein